MRPLMTFMALSALLVSGAALANTIDLVPIADNTLYEDPEGDVSNGGGNRIFAGRTGQGSNSIRRAVLRFDLGAIPAGATVTNAYLFLTIVQVSDTTARDYPVHRLLASWGEGTTVAGGGQGSGGAATAGSATWLHWFYPDSLWINPGGDHVATPSASSAVGTTLGGAYLWTDVLLTADVQAWVDDPGSNHGWLVRGSETEAGTTRAFASREDPTPANRPLLRITYEPPVPVVPSTWGGLKSRHP